MALILHPGLGVHARRDLVPHFPQLFIKNMLLALTKNVHRTTRGTQDIAADDAMRELHMMKTEELNSLVAPPILTHNDRSAVRRPGDDERLLRRVGQLDGRPGAIGGDSKNRTGPVCVVFCPSNHTWASGGTCTRM